MTFQPQDHYFKKAKQMGYRARSAFKLEMIQKKFHLISKRDKVLDIGAAPGSWMQVVLGIIGPQGRVVGVDMRAIPSLRDPRAITVCGDIRDDDMQKKIVLYAPFDVVISDIAPSTTGFKLVDQSQSLGLTHTVQRIALTVLRVGGSLVLKVFESLEVPDFVRQLQKVYGTVVVYKPRASRAESFEIYIICTGKI